VTGNAANLGVAGMAFSSQPFAIHAPKIQPTSVSTGENCGITNLECIRKYNDVGTLKKIAYSLGLFIIGCGLLTAFAFSIAAVAIIFSIAGAIAALFLPVIKYMNYVRVKEALIFAENKQYCRRLSYKLYAEKGKRQDKFLLSNMLTLCSETTAGEFLRETDARNLFMKYYNEHDEDASIIFDSFPDEVKTFLLAHHSNVP
jgi:hypothetical protein